MRPRNPIIITIILIPMMISTIILITIQTGQATTQRKDHQALHTEVKDPHHMKTQVTRRITTQRQKAVTILNMTAKKSLVRTDTTDRRKITSPSVRTMKMTMHKIIPQVGQEQVSRDTNRVAATTKPGIQRKTRMEIQRKANTSAPITTMEVQPEAKKDLGQIMEGRQTTTAVRRRTTGAPTTTMSMVQVRRKATAGQTTKTIMGIPIKTMEAGRKAAIEAATMTPDLSTQIPGKSTVRVIQAMMWMTTVGLTQGQVKSMEQKKKVTSTITTSTMNSTMTTQEARGKSIQNSTTTMLTKRMMFPTTMMMTGPGQVMMNQRVMERHQSSSPNYRQTMETTTIPATIQPATMLLEREEREEAGEASTAATPPSSRRSTPARESPGKPMIQPAGLAGLPETLTGTKWRRGQGETKATGETVQADNWALLVIPLVGEDPVVLPLDRVGRPQPAV